MRRQSLRSTVVHVVVSSTYAVAVGSPDVLTIKRLAKGLFVEYLGETTTEDMVVGIDDPPPICDRLWHGHPGVIWEPVPQHVQVTWVGLEDTAQSFGVSHSCNDAGSYGLGVITSAEYEKRRLCVLAGQAPICPPVSTSPRWARKSTSSLE